MRAPNIAHGGMNERMTARMPKKALSHLHVEETENGGHIVTHHFSSGHEPEIHAFPEPKGEVAIPEGHVLEHIAQHMGVPHHVGDGDPEMATVSQDGDEPAEQEAHA